MQRIPEPELMDDEAQARAYAQADFEAPHTSFIEQFQSCFAEQLIACPVLDLGCGPADISIRFARAYPQCQVHGIDGAAAMLKYGEQAVQQQGLSERIRLVHGYLPQASAPLPHYPVIISNSLLHHLHDPMVLWNTIKAYSQPGTRVFIMDLMRPVDEATAASMVQEYAAGEPEILQHDFYHSLLAAFEIAEVEQQLQTAGLAHLEVRAISDRHLTVHGVM